MNTLDTLSLLDAARGGDNDACERLLLENSGLIWSVARRYYGRGVDPEDLYQLGCLGFLKAVRGFDTSYGTQFSTYAVPKIAGEIRRFLRDDGSVKVSRGLKERAMALRISGSPPDGLNERCLGSKEAFFVRIQDCNQCDLRYVQSLSQKIDAHKHVKDIQTHIPNNLCSLQRVNI